MSKKPSEAAENARPLVVSAESSSPAVPWPKPLYYFADTRAFVDQLKRTIE